MVTAAQCCERIQDKHKALVSAGSLKPLSQEAHVRDVLKVGFASRFLQTIRYFLWAKAPNTPQRCGGSFGLLGALAQTIAMVPWGTLQIRIRFVRQRFNPTLVTNKQRIF